MNVRELFTEHENQLTAAMPDLVAVGFVNARRKDGLGERRDRLVVNGTTVMAIPVFGGFGNPFDAFGFGGQQ